MFMLALRVVPVLAVLALAESAGAASCPDLFVPEGYGATCESGAGERAWELRVRPEAEVPDPLTQLTIWPLEERVDAPEAWLRQQIKLNMADLAGSLRDTLRQTENPWIPPALVDSLEGLTDYMRSLDELPLRGCDQPERRADGTAWEMRCSWELGPFTQLAMLRLVERDGEPVAVSAWATSERRLRHLTAIANAL